MTDQDILARRWVHDCAFVAENMRALGHAITDQEAYWFGRISCILTSCLVGDTWAEFRLLSPEKRAHFVTEWMIDAKVPRLVRERYDNAVGSWFTGASGNEPLKRKDSSGVSTPEAPIDNEEMF